jgi:hypothetical protein
VVYKQQNNGQYNSGRSSENWRWTTFPLSAHYTTTVLESVDYINKGVPKLKKRVSGNPWWQGRSEHHNWSQGSASCYSSKNFPIPLLLLLVPSRKQVYLLFTPTCKKEENPLQFICELVSSSLSVCLMDIAMKQRCMTVSAHKLMPASKVRWLDTEYKGPL